jgi:predicted nucleic acid-binding protein
MQEKKGDVYWVNMKSFLVQGKIEILNKAYNPIISPDQIVNTISTLLTKKTNMYIN